MGYQIRMAPQVEAWLAAVRDRDPAAADRIDEAVGALRAGGDRVGPPLVVTVGAHSGAHSRTLRASMSCLRLSVPLDIEARQYRPTSIFLEALSQAGGPDHGIPPNRHRPLTIGR